MSENENTGRNGKKDNGIKWLIGIGLAYLGIRAIGTGVGYKQAYDNISYSVNTKTFKIGGSILSPTLRIIVDVLLSNPTQESFTIEQPDIILLYGGTNIGFSKPSFAKTTLAAKSQAVIKDIDITFGLMPIIKDLGLLSIIKDIFNGGFAKIKETIEAKKALILKKMIMRLMLNINGFQVNYDTPLI